MRRIIECLERDSLRFCVTFARSSISCSKYAAGLQHEKKPSLDCDGFRVTCFSCGGCRLLLFFLLAVLASKLLLELLDAPHCVNELLLTGVKRVRAR